MGFIAGASMSWAPVLIARDPQKFDLFFVFLAPHLLYLLLLFFVYKNMEAAAFGLAAGLFLVPLLVGIPFHFMVGFLSGGLGADTARILSSFVPGSVALALGTLVGWLQSKAKMLLLGTGLVGCFTVLLILAASWSAWSHTPVRTSRDMDREAIYKAFNRVHACNQMYSKENSEKSFVASLNQLGPKGTKCLSQNEVDGMVGNRQLLYEPGPARDGRIATYRLTTQMSFFVDKYRLETDQSGVMIYRGPDGEIGQPTIASVDVHNLRDFWLCLITIFRREGNFPSSFRAAASSDLCHNLMPRPEQTDFFHFANENTLVGANYEFIYTPLPGKIPGQISDFRIDARPRNYGTSGVRSYVVFKDRLIHGTPEDRPAQLSDPADTRFGE